MVGLVLTLVTFAWYKFAVPEIDKRIAAAQNPIVSALEFQNFLMMESMPDSAIAAAEKKIYNLTTGKGSEMKLLLILSILFLSCYPQRERTKYYILTFENQAGMIHQATVTKRLYDFNGENIYTAGVINIRPVGYKCVGIRVIDRGDTTYEY